MALPDDLFPAAEAAAARQGRLVRESFTATLQEKLRDERLDAPLPLPPWMKEFGASAESPAERFAPSRTPP